MTPRRSEFPHHPARFGRPGVARCQKLAPPGAPTLRRGRPRGTASRLRRSDAPTLRRQRTAGRHPWWEFWSPI